jgi:VanZ like family/Concanavalin A-like lectin/glucanases superfamily
MASFESTTQEVCRQPKKSRLLGPVCFCVLCGILLAGLWPFHSPKNDVSWLVGGHGLKFGRHGTVLSVGGFNFGFRGNSTDCSLEIWLRPASGDGSNTILTFYSGGNQAQFSIHQSEANLDAIIHKRDLHGRELTDRLFVQDVFSEGKSVLITITAHAGKATIYLNGLPAGPSRGFPLSRSDFVGRLVIANSPVQNDSWSGTLYALAFYSRSLAPWEILDGYNTSALNRPRRSNATEGLVAEYLFNEHSGNLVHDQVQPGINLIIPRKYVVLDEKLLEPFWEEFRFEWWYFEQVFINIGGFMPLGFFLYAFFASAVGPKRALLLTMLFGFATSVTIEVLQAFLPTRDSGTTDIITNTLGTYLGVTLYRWDLSRRLYRGVLVRLRLSELL